MPTDDQLDVVTRIRRDVDVSILRDLGSLCRDSSLQSSVQEVAADVVKRDQVGDDSYGRVAAFSNFMDVIRD